MNESLSETYTYLYHTIIEELLSQIVQNNKECFHYDIWAYAKLFYHLELYNQPAFTTACHEYLKTRPVPDQ